MLKHLPVHPATNGQTNGYYQKAAKSFVLACILPRIKASTFAACKIGPRLLSWLFSISNNQPHAPKAQHIRFTSQYVRHFVHGLSP